jgi:hypothetical protein
MSELKVVGKLDKLLEKQSGTSNKGKDWVKQSFLVKSKEQYNNLYCFEVFGKDKVDNLASISVGSTVEVSFNVGTNEWNGKYYTSLSAWRISSESSTNQTEEPTFVESDDDLPF